MVIQGLQPAAVATATPAAAGAVSAEVIKTPAIDLPTGKVAAQAIRPAPEPVSERVMAKVAQRLEQFLNSSRRDIQFRVDEDANATVVTVRNASTGEVVRQFPNEEALRMMRRLNEGSASLVDLTA
jgi:flagellar protein FlaG